MVQDLAGAALIGTAGCLLLVRLILAIHRKREISAALRKHHAAPTKRWPGVAAARALWHSVPPRLRMGLTLAMLSTALGLAPSLLRRTGVATPVLDGTLARALHLAAKWTMIGGVLRWVQASALNKFRAPRAG